MDWSNYKGVTTVGCIHGCREGRLFFPPAGTMVDCPKCMPFIKKEKEKEKAKIADVLDRGCNNNYDNNIDSYIADSVNYSLSSVNKVKDVLYSVKKGILDKETYKHSFYLYSGRVDVKKYIGDMIMLALEKGLKAVPYVSLNTLHSLLVATHSPIPYDSFTGEYIDNTPPEDKATVFDGKKFIKEFGVTYYDYTRADVLFLDATAGTTKQGFIAAADVLGERSRLGLPTYMFGFWTSSSVSNTNLKYILSRGKPRLDQLVTYGVEYNSDLGKGK